MDLFLVAESGSGKRLLSLVGKTKGSYSLLASSILAGATMSIPFNQLQDKEIVTEKNFEQMVEEIRRILEECTEEFEDVPF
jgi:hypothetical protein